MSRPRLFFAAMLSSLAASAPLAVSAAEPVQDPAKIEFFEKKVRPLLVANCYNCHSANTNAKGGLRVDDRNGLVNGGGRGSAVVPGDPGSSLLIDAVKYADNKLKMPPEKKLADEEIAILEQWVKDGAAWPAVEIPFDLGASEDEYKRLRAEHWAWQPLTHSAVPAVRNTAWAKDDVDRFVLARLEEADLAPTGDADKASLLRRVTFDLTGLPPKPEEIDAFLADNSSGAFEMVVDRLLQSSAFGERWGRHWLDVARYGESTGSSRNVPYPHSWRYRDYVIDAFNKDKPYDQFVREQIAGDLLSAATPEERDEHLVATGFLALGVKDVNQRFKVRFVMDNIDEQIDTVSRSVLGLTASCARCHDHKFDPIPTADYYALAGIFQSTDLCAGVRNKMGGGGMDYYDTSMLLPLSQKGAEVNTAERDAQIAAAQAKVAKAKAEFETLQKDPESTKPGPNGRPPRQQARQRLNRAQQELLALNDPAAQGAVALGVRDAKAIGDTEIRIRGEAEKLGPKIPRGFLQVVKYAGQPEVGSAQSGRLELADWLVSPENPLTSRVVVNRVWQHLFADGLVLSVDNFGTTGDKPSHPELLDHLAARFVREGWSFKKLIRELVLTRTYQLSSEAIATNVAVDPANRLQWRHTPRRLAAEEIRDATLAAADKLQAGRPKQAVVSEHKVMEMRNNGPEARGITQSADTSQARSVYLPLLRGITPNALQVFDFAEQGMVTGHRDTTTVAPQALYLLNDPFVRGHSLTLAEGLLGNEKLDDEARIQRAYRLTLGREALSSEVQRALAFLKDYETTLAAVSPASAPAAQANKIAKADVPKEPEETADSTSGSTADADAKPKKPAAPVNPDEADQTDAPVTEVVIQARNPRTAAWASFVQALVGSAEFRYLK